jgi:hypothetical protein
MVGVANEAAKGSSLPGVSAEEAAIIFADVCAASADEKARLA